DGEQQSDTVDQQQKTSNYEPLERRMTPGGSITFTCRIGLIDQVRQSIQWYHDDKLISILDRRGSLSVETDRSSNFFASRLTLASVTRSDSGKYTCKSGNTNSTTFTLHVISPVYKKHKHLYHQPLDLFQDNFENAQVFESVDH
ncbi:PREDICTED: uncharacterized protein LOC107169557, partial [Diuraphis noxia]|uniref:uncharacterized protein LOC107169557 n=1 Tax=Diuraphis noxia TaxID=143948 RepID=UPI00076371E3